MTSENLGTTATREREAEAVHQEIDSTRRTLGQTVTLLADKADASAREGLRTAREKAGHAARRPERGKGVALAAGAVALGALAWARSRRTRPVARKDRALRAARAFGEGALAQGRTALTHPVVLSTVDRARATAKTPTNRSRLEGASGALGALAALGLARRAARRPRTPDA
ncbi:hypothetical protein EDD29_2215 [Actinocorallia herbida]|uniref:DUF3618 domain-containing protein n=1 Tax=Actinocorallia herbida TaxID=58109 RepID=A0A3N1CVF7_9ACTN|nr:hypothetical protein [Actinocorallia herbida]ROO84688.1 hypothetical protein EDD29_2215 [Actinocorallia herbida]